MKNVPIVLDWFCINSAVDAFTVDVVVGNDVVEVIPKIRKITYYNTDCFNYDHNYIHSFHFIYKFYREYLVSTEFYYFCL